MNTHTAVTATPTPLAHPPQTERWLARGLAALPFVTLGVSFLFTVAVGGRALEADRWPWLLATIAAVLALRVWMLRASPGRERVAGFAANLVLTLVLVSISPLFGVYAFVGYLDAGAALPGRGQPLGLMAAASLNALAQSGGPLGAAGNPSLFLFLLLANSGLAVGMVQIDRHRQQTVTRLQAALEELEQAQRLNETLQQQLVEQARTSGMLDERARLSRDIHDTVAQGLIAVLRQIEAASEASSLVDARAVLDRADRTARDCLGEARRAVAALASPLLDDADLPCALTSLCSTWSTDTGIAARFRAVGDIASSPHDADLLRICQEALANVARHSGASGVEVSLVDHGDRLLLTVHDDGAGFDPQTKPGSGLPGIRERLRNVGGLLTIDCPESGGCVLTAEVPR